MTNVKEEQVNWSWLMSIFTIAGIYYSVPEALNILNGVPIAFS
jgi:hypothetical protein